jgi:hypothetical protein
VADLADDWVGSVQVDSLPWWSPGSEPVFQPALAGVVTFARPVGVAGTHLDGAMAYSLQAAPPPPAQPGEPRAGAGMVAIPRWERDLEAPDEGADLVVMDATPGSGFTRFALFVFDQNGLWGNLCQTVGTGQTAYLPLRAWGIMWPGHAGGAIVSAMFWEHDLPGAPGQVHDVVHLTVVTLERPNRWAGDAAPRDAAVAEAGIPVSRSAARTMAPNLPLEPPPCRRPLPVAP